MKRHLVLSAILLSLAFCSGGCGDVYLVSGNATGVIGTFTATLSVSGDDQEIIIEENGFFYFPIGLDDGTSYAVELSGYEDDGMSCTVSGGENGDGSGTIDGAHVTDIVVTCVGV
jgi:hypothetical protein